MQTVSLQALLRLDKADKTDSVFEKKVFGLLFKELKGSLLNERNARLAVNTLFSTLEDATFPNEVMFVLYKLLHATVTNKHLASALGIDEAFESSHIEPLLDYFTKLASKYGANLDREELTQFIQKYTEV